MEQLRPVSKLEKILFPIITTIVVVLILPTTAPLVGMLMLGNLFKESGVVKQLTEIAPRREIIEESLSKSGKIIITNNFEEAIHVTNEYAPEHLIISTKDDDETLSHVNNAGSIFLGSYSPVAAGDYGSGTNHVLPTGGGAKMYSGLSTEAFIKKPTVQRITKDGLKELSKTSVPIAEYEGFYEHAKSFKTRLRDD